jgi:hypothetical protein
MTPGQYNAAMINFCGWRSRLFGIRPFCPLNQRPAAGRTPIRHVIFCQHCVALAANSFHTQEIT